MGSSSATTISKKMSEICLFIGPPEVLEEKTAVRVLRAPDHAPRRVSGISLTPWRWSPHERAIPLRGIDRKACAPQNVHMLLSVRARRAATLHFPPPQS